MKLPKLISADQVFIHLEASTIEEALQVVATCLAHEAGLEADAVATALLERERLGSTSVGEGFAIPHCKLGGLKSIKIALARFEQGVDFNAGDGIPVTFFFVVLSPPDQPAAHLQVLSQIARVLKGKVLRHELLEAADAESVVQAVRRIAEVEGL